MKIKILSLMVVLVFIFSGMLLGHPGKLRADGGHCDYKKKEYHYHKNGKVVGASKAKFEKLCKGKKTRTVKKKLKAKKATKKDKKDTKKRVKRAKKDKKIEKKGSKDLKKNSKKKRISKKSKKKKKKKKIIEE